MHFRSKIYDTHAKTSQNQLKPEEQVYISKTNVYHVNTDVYHLYTSSKSNDLANNKASHFNIYNKTQLTSKASYFRIYNKTQLK